MRRSLLSSLVVSALLSVCAGARVFLEHESVPLHQKNGWLPSAATLPSPCLTTLRVSFHKRNLEELERRTLAVSLPKSPQYGQHLSLEQVIELIEPAAESKDTVIGWLCGESTRDREECVSRFEFDTTRTHVTIRAIECELVERLFSVKLETFVHPLRPGLELLRSREAYSVPDFIAPHVHHVRGITNFPPATARLGTYTPMSGNDAHDYTFPGTAVDPPFIWELYNITFPDYVHPNTSQACGEFEEAYFYPRDIETFLGSFNLTHLEISVDGKNNPYDGYLGEATLDFEYITAVNGAKVSTWDFSQKGFELDIVMWSETVLATDGAPLIHSISWGSGESTYPLSQINDENEALMTMAGLGYTVLMASGDDGTGNTGTFLCDSYDPNWPASSQWCTAVGGTYYDDTQDEQVGWEQSGGGFSTFLGRPVWQSAVVDYYLNNTSDLPPTKHWNATGRATPDVSALATNFKILSEDSWGFLSGTSAATPTFAAILALANNERFIAGRAPIGFVNPALYDLSFLGFDVTQGTNEAGTITCTTGFPAAPGWDAITGLGTPSAPIVLDYFANVGTTTSSSGSY